jgi:hypothetical protein
MPRPVTAQARTLLWSFFAFFYTPPLTPAGRRQHFPSATLMRPSNVRVKGKPLSYFRLAPKHKKSINRASQPLPRPPGQAKIGMGQYQTCLSVGGRAQSATYRRMLPRANDKNLSTVFRTSSRAPRTPTVTALMSMSQARQ